MRRATVLVCVCVCVCACVSVGACSGDARQATGKKKAAYAAFPEYPLDLEI